MSGSFTAVQDFVSYDSDNPSTPRVCGDDTYGNPNALFCPSADLIAWDRGVLVPIGQQFFGDASIAALLAHEYGHAVQAMAHLVEKGTPTLVFEQQADCFAGAYSRWVAEGHSPRFELSTGDGLNHVLAGVLTLRDPTYGPADAPFLEDGHGTALDRVGAFQMGFTAGASECAKIDVDEIAKRRGDLPQTLPAESSGEVPVDEDTVRSLVEVFQPSAAPTLSFDAASCADAQPSPPASYCPTSYTIFVDLPALARLGKQADLKDYSLLQGDNSALSVLTSRYALAVEHEHGDALDSAVAALRTACLTGVAQRAMAENISLALVLTGGDIDEAVAGLLTNGLVASNVNGETVPAGFTRIVAFRSGLAGDEDLCYARFAWTHGLTRLSMGTLVFRSPTPRVRGGLRQMARKTIVEWVDDIDGSVASETVTFAIDGSRYEIDLSEKNAEKLRGLMGAWIDASRRSTNRRARESRRKVDSAEATEARKWARDNGFDVGPRGRLRAEVLDAYRSRTSGT